MKLERSIERWNLCSPSAIAKGSEAQILFYLRDAQLDIAALAAEVGRLERQLKLMSMTAVGAEKEADDAYAEIARLKAEYAPTIS